MKTSDVIVLSQCVMIGLTRVQLVLGQNYI
jgi:hypothetical protein